MVYRLSTTHDLLIRLGVLSILFLLLLHAGPRVEAQNTSTTTSNCPEAVMAYFALPLSSRVNNIQSNLTTSSSNAEVASEINAVVPDIGQALNVSIPVLFSSDRGLQSLVGPFNNFLETSRQVNPQNSDSACTFLIATAELGAFVILIATGNVEGTAMLNLFNEAGKDCGSTCQSAIESAVTNFAEQNVQGAVSEVTSAVCGSNDPVNSICQTPEFPFGLVPAIVFTVLVVASYTIIRRRQNR